MVKLEQAATNVDSMVLSPSHSYIVSVVDRAVASEGGAVAELLDPKNFSDDTEEEIEQEMQCWEINVDE